MSNTSTSSNVTAGGAGEGAGGGGGGGGGGAGGGGGEHGVPPGGFGTVDVAANGIGQRGPTHVPYFGHGGGRSLILDVGAAVGGKTIDLRDTLVDRAGLEKINPHRHEMALLDKVIWRSLDLRQSVALWRVRDDEFWVRGHFPGKPMLPGVLQIEAGAQLGVFMYNSRFPEPRVAAFTHITDVSYRTPVTPGDMFYLLCQELKCSGRRFTSHIQGVVISSDASGTPSLSTAKLTFEAMISGMSLG